MGEFHLFCDLPAPLRRAIFLAAWRDEDGWASKEQTGALRLACREACATLDAAIEGLRLEGRAAVEAFVRAHAGAHSERFSALRGLTARSRPVDEWDSSMARAATTLALAQVIPPRLQSLYLCDMPVDQRAAAALAAAGAGLSELRLISSRISDDSLEVLIRSSWRSLEHLQLANNLLTPHAAKLLAAASELCLPALRHLNLAFNGLGDAGVRDLASVPWPCLETLNLDYNDIGTPGVLLLASAGGPLFQGAAGVVDVAAAHMYALRTLSLGGNDLSGLGPWALLLFTWHHLERLNLQSASLDVGGCQALAAVSGTKLPRLRALDLGTNPGSGAGVQALVQGHWSRLEELYLNGNGVGPAEAAALGGGSARFSALQNLVLCDNGIGDAGAHGLVQGPWHRLQSLNLSRNGIGPDGAAAVAAAATACLPALQHLDLSGNALHDAGARALAQVVWPALRDLWLYSNSVGHGGAKALAAGGAAHRFPVLKVLSVGEQSLPEEQIAALRAALSGVKVS